MNTLICEMSSKMTSLGFVYVEFDGNIKPCNSFEKLLKKNCDIFHSLFLWTPKSFKDEGEKCKHNV